MNDFDDLDPMSAGARSLLDEVRGHGGGPCADDPSAPDKARVRRALMATLAGGAGIAASSAASSAAASAAGTTGTLAAGTLAASALPAGAVTAGAIGAGAGGAAAAGGLSLGVKLAALIVVVGAVGGTVASAPWEPGSDEPRARVEAAATATEPSARATPARGRAPVDAPATRIEPAEPTEAAQPSEGAEPPSIEEAEPAPGPAPAATAPARRARTRPLAATSSTPAPSTLAEEVGLLRRAQAAIHAGEPERALTTLSDHARRFPEGTMAEERDAARVMALRDAGRLEEARRAAARFLRERPSSPLAARVRACCE